MSINKVIVKRLKKAAEAAYLTFTLTGPLAGLPIAAPEAAMGKMAKCHLESVESRRALKKREEDILAFILNSKTDQGV